MAFKPSSAPHSTGASGTSSLHSVGDPDYDHFLEKTKLSHSSNEVLTTRSPAGLHISPTPTPPTSARRDRGNPISTSSSKSKGQASTSATATSRDNEVLKYSEFLPKLVQERQRLETELKLLATQHRAIKKRRRTLQRLTKERVLKIQPPPPPQQAPVRPSAWAEHSSPKSGTKRQVKIMAPRETHGVFAMLGLSTASLGTKDRERDRERERANTTISSSSTVKKERRSNTTTNVVHVNTGEMMNATSSTMTTTAQQQTSFSASATPTKVAGSMAGGFARNMVAGQFASSPGGLNRASGPLATKAGHGHLQGSPRQALTNSSAVATSGPAEEDDGEGRRFFGTSKYRKYEMDVMKDDGFADLFSKFQASGIGHGEDDDEESEDKRAAAADAGVAAAAQSDAAEGGAVEDLKATAAAAATTVDSGADSGEKAAVEVSTAAKASKEEESGGGGSSGEEKEKGGDSSDRERKVAVAVGVEVGSGEEETEAEEPAKRAAKRASKRASSLLGSFIEMKRDYQKMLNEFEEKQKDNSIDANDKIAELQAILKQLRREQAALRARVQTSQDDAQLLESFSVGVSLFDKKKEDEASSKFGETRNRRKSRENAADKKKKEKKESEDEADDDNENDNDEKKQKKKKKKKKEKANDGDGGDEVDAAVRAKQANALAEYGADSAAFATTVRSSAVAEYGAAASTTTSESSLGFTVVAAACGGSSATAEYGAAGATSTAEYGGSAVAEYGAAAAGDDGDSNNGDEWDENKKKGKDKRRKRVGSRNKSNKSSGGGAGEGAGKEDANNEEDSNGASASSSTTASTEAAKARKRKKKRLAKRASVREILLKAYHEIAYEELQFDPKPLGNGAFGVVYKALWRGTPVAVKKLMVMQFTDAEVYNFKREASIMEKYSNHPCIVKFCGISTKFPHYCIVTEYMERGCVRDALADNPDLPWKTIVGMALDAAAGILHLHAEHIIHRDLALRNMLVGRDWRVRMADFGLARMMPKDTYAKTRGNIGAVRWLAPEVISKSVYSEKSDSYAFGIVMWELLTRGEEPFADMTNVMEVALGIINEGLRPTVPRETPAEYAQLMSDCWAKNADDRPDFVQIHRRLKAYHATLP